MPHNEKGEEILDPTPVAMPVGFHRPPSLAEQVRRLVRTEFSRQAAALGEETFEEADDFDCGDDPELKSKYELDDEHDRNIDGLKQFIAESKRTKKVQDEVPVDRKAKKKAASGDESEEE